MSERVQVKKNDPQPKMTLHQEQIMLQAEIIDIDRKIYEHQSEAHRLEHVRRSKGKELNEVLQLAAQERRMKASEHNLTTDRLLLRHCKDLVGEDAFATLIEKVKQEKKEHE